MRFETNGRRLRFESLEQRRMMATFTVTKLTDAVVTAGGQAPGTLRQAIFDANATPGVADVIVFSPALTGSVALTNFGGQAEGASALVVSSPITIRGNANGITIARGAAAPEMRLFHVTAGGNLSLESINVTGGVARGEAGDPGENGGEGHGGAVYNEGTLVIVGSTLYNNLAIGGAAGAGGNPGPGRGGAIYNADGVFTIRNSTLSGNQAQNGAGNTLSDAFGGGIYALNGSLAIYNSTITNSSALTGRGVYFVAIGDSANAIIESTIIAQADDSRYDLYASSDFGGTVAVTGANNLIRWLNDFTEIAIAEFRKPGLGDPRLEALADNGGPTLTHALQADSPAIDRGANPQNLTTDQRGATFSRHLGAGVDVGAFESLAVAPALRGDYNRDNFVSAADYVVWRKFLNANVGNYALADGDGNGVINSLDFDVWNESFGEAQQGGSFALSGQSEAPLLAIAVATADRSARSYDNIAFTSKVEVAPRRHAAKSAIDSASRVDNALDKALLALLAAWDGAVLGGRESMGFECDRIGLFVRG